jgi:hypothetical protein
MDACWCGSGVGSSRRLVWGCLRRLMLAGFMLGWPSTRLRMLSRRPVRTWLRMDGLSGVMSRIESFSSTISKMRSSTVGTGWG